MLNERVPELPAARLRHDEPVRHPAPAPPQIPHARTERDEAEHRDEPAVLIRCDERKPVFTSKERLDLAGISGPYGHFFMAGAVANVEPGADSGPKHMEHPGEELIFMLDGTMSFEVEGVEYMLRRGDALHFRTDRPHRWGNPAARPARAIWMALRST